MIVTRPITTNYGNYDRKVSVQHGSGVLKPGQIIDAVALTNSKHGHVSIRIGDTVINASTNITLHQNARLSLEVVQIQPQLLLRLIQSADSSAATRPLQDAIIRLLPYQSGMAPVLAELIHKSMTGAKPLDQHHTRALVSTLINTLPTRNTLMHATGVRQAIYQSGLFLESILSRSQLRSKTGITKDIKAGLLRIQHNIGQIRRDCTPYDRTPNNPGSGLINVVSPPRRKRLPAVQARAPINRLADVSDLVDDRNSLYSKIQGAIARLGLFQVHTAENFHRGEYLWQLEIPVKHTEAVETVSITIENEQKDPQHEDRNAWVVNLALDLPQLGPIQVRISMYSRGISSCFWSDSAGTLSLIESRFEQLRSSLRQQGLETLALCCQQGQPIDTEALDTDVSVIDLKV